MNRTTRVAIRIAIWIEHRIVIRIATRITIQSKRLEVASKDATAAASLRNRSETEAKPKRNRSSNKPISLARRRLAANSSRKAFPFVGRPRSHSNLMERNQQARNHTMITHQAVPLYYGRWCACKQRRQLRGLAFRNIFALFAHIAFDLFFLGRDYK